MNGKKLTDEAMEGVTGGASALKVEAKSIACCGLCGQPVQYLDQVRVEGGNTGSYKCTNVACQNGKDGKILYNNQVKWKPAAK